jgi:hypothetical protein
MLGESVRKEKKVLNIDNRSPTLYTIKFWTKPGPPKL